MFPEITRDEVFRIETQRLWLRWPTFADVDDLAKFGAPCSQGGAHESGHPEAARGLIRSWRSATATGQGLHLLIVPKPSPRRPIGWVQIVASGSDAVLSAFLRPDERGKGLGIEAHRGLHDMARWLGVVAFGMEDRPVEKPVSEGVVRLQ